MPRKPKSDLLLTLPPPPAATMKLSVAAQAMVDDIEARWTLNPPVQNLLRLAAETMTAAEACDAVTAVEGLTIRDAKGSIKVHPLAALSAQLKNAASATIQKILLSLG